MATVAATPDLTRAVLLDSVAGIIGKRELARGRFGIAVSGGPDSMALLTLANQALPGRVAAATVDHGLRTDSATEAALVAGYCATIAVPHTILRPANPITGSLQAAARRARYTLLETWRLDAGIDWLMTAHHADDQLETMIMRLNRASGLAGLSGIRPRQGHILRPLLGVTRQSICAMMEKNRIPSIADPSNQDPRFDRARLRAALAGHDLLDATMASTSARHLAQEEEALDWVIGQLSLTRLNSDGGSCTIDMASLPPALRRRLLIRALTALGEPPPRGDALDGALQTVLRGGKAMLGNQQISRDADVWALRPAPPRRRLSPRSD